MPPKIEAKPISEFTHQGNDRQIANQLILAVKGDTLRSIATATSYNTETTRRYMRGESRIPADFVKQIALLYHCDIRDLLAIPKDTRAMDLREISTDKLINELGRRMTMVENCAIASVVVG